MNKANPNEIIDDFEKSTKLALKDWQSTDKLLSNAHKDDRLRLRRRLASDSFLALSISWESFMSAWFVAALNRDPSQALITNTNRMREFAIHDLRIPSSVVATKLFTTSHLNLENTRGMLDPNGYNITMSNRNDFKKKANRWLAGDYRLVATAVTTVEYSPALLGRLVRNAFAHQSESALAAANTAVRSTSMAPDFRITTVSNLGVSGWRAYTRQEVPPTNKSRVELFHTALEDLATKLKTP